MPRLVVVEDQKKLLASLQRGLEEEGYEVISAATGEQGYYAATTESVDAVVLDLMLPGRDGIRVLRDLRAHGFTRPVLILTARDAIEDRVLGLDSGADDYLVKPNCSPGSVPCCGARPRGASWSYAPTTWRWTYSPAASSVPVSNWT
jgi:DNA-binding response OmpR family regulator